MRKSKLIKELSENSKALKQKTTDMDIQCIIGGALARLMAMSTYKVLPISYKVGIALVLTQVLKELTDDENIINAHLDTICTMLKIDLPQ